jgi:hypothetical protein
MVTYLLARSRIGEANRPVRVIRRWPGARQYVAATTPGKPDRAFSLAPPDSAVKPKGRESMSWVGWTTMGIIYLVLVFTVAFLTFRKGHWVLGLVGFIFPILWLIGAVLPPRRAYR